MSSTRWTALGTALILLSAAGCGGEGGGGVAEQGKPAATTAPMGSDFGSQMNAAAKNAMSGLADNYAEQVKQQQSQLDTLKASAAGYGDQELDALLGQLDGVLKQLSGKVGEIKNADEGSAAALQKEIQKLLSQSGDLFKKAQARLAELGG